MLIPELSAREIVRLTASGELSLGRSFDVHLDAIAPPRTTSCMLL